MNTLSSFIRGLPSFKGKSRIASLLLNNTLYRNKERTFEGKYGIRYTIPNSIDSVSRELFINGIYEEKTIRTIEKLLNKNTIFFDVGANIGAICLPVTKLTGATAHVFEPSTATFHFLKKNVEQNKMNIIMNYAAVHSTDGMEIEFFAVEEKHGHSSLAPTISGQQPYMVNTVSLDGYCGRHNIQVIDVLKIDVQGFEYEVLQGASTLIRERKIRNIIFEFEGWAEGNTDFKSGASQEFLLSNGYNLYSLDNIKVERKLVTGSIMLWAKPKR